MVGHGDVVRASRCELFAYASSPCSSYLLRPCQAYLADVMARLAELKWLGRAKHPEVASRSKSAHPHTHTHKTPENPR